MTAKKECIHHNGLPIFRCTISYSDSLCLHSRKHRDKCKNYRGEKYRMRLAKVKEPIDCPYCKRFMRGNTDIYICTYEDRNIECKWEYQYGAGVYDFPKNCPLPEVEE